MHLHSQVRKLNFLMRKYQKLICSNAEKHITCQNYYFENYFKRKTVEKYFRKRANYTNLNIGDRYNNQYILLLGRTHSTYITNFTEGKNNDSVRVQQLMH